MKIDDRNEMIDSGACNDIMKGLLVQVLKEHGEPTRTITECLQLASEILDDMSAEELHAIYKNFK